MFLNEPCSSDVSFPRSPGMHSGVLPSVPTARPPFTRSRGRVSSPRLPRLGLRRRPGRRPRRTDRGVGPLSGRAVGGASARGATPKNAALTVPDCASCKLVYSGRFSNCCARSILSSFPSNVIFNLICPTEANCIPQIFSTVFKFDILSINIQIDPKTCTH